MNHTPINLAVWVGLVYYLTIRLLIALDMGDFLVVIEIGEFRD